MSPALVLTKDRAEFHIPWKLPVFDGRSARERITAEENICSVVFTGQDTCAVCCILNADGGRTASLSKVQQICRCLQTDHRETG